MAAALRLSFFRPLRSAHWALPLALIGCLLFVVWGRPCREGPYYVEIVAGTLLLTIVAWANHVGAAPIRTSREALSLAVSSLKDTVLLLVGSVLASVPLAVVMPAYQCYTDRTKAMEVILSGSTLRAEIEQNALTQRTLAGSGKGVEFHPNGRSKWGMVTNEGQIVVVGDDPPVVFTLTPSLVDGSITWTCRGFPSKLAPKMCRNKDET